MYYTVGVRHVLIILFRDDEHVTVSFSARGHKFTTTLIVPPATSWFIVIYPVNCRRDVVTWKMYEYTLQPHPRLSTIKKGTSYNFFNKTDDKRNL
jgi:hypothetical protein